MNQTRSKHGVENKSAEHPEVGGTHEDHQGQILTPHKATKEPSHLGALPKRFLNTGMPGAITTSVGSLFWCPKDPPSGGSFS